MKYSTWARRLPQWRPTMTLNTAVGGVLAFAVLVLAG